MNDHAARAIGPCLLATLLLGGCRPPPAPADAGRPADERPAEEGPVDVEVVVRSVLSGRAGTVSGDGDRRFFEVRFRIPEGADGEAPDIRRDEIPGDVRPPLGGACRADRLFVHFPVRGWPEPPLAGPAEEFRRALAGQLRPELRDWWFSLDPAQPWLHVQQVAVCPVVRSLRRAAVAVAPGAAEGDEARVAAGRVCSLSGMAGEEPFTEAMRRWHLDRIDPAWEDPGVEPAGGVRVHVALVDSGVEAGLVGATEEAPEQPFSDELPPEMARHGTLMGLAIRQLAPWPEVVMHSLRIFDPGGQATTHDLATALDHALFEIERSGSPLVVNLSLGWPPELGRRRLVQTVHSECDRLGCGSEDPSSPDAVFEDGAGEAVRYVLDQARALDREGEPVVVVAAAGNRPGAATYNAGVYESAFGVAGSLSDSCVGDEPITGSWFLPGEWGYVPTCEETADTPPGRRFTALTVGALDVLDGPGIFTGLGSETATAAPGEHVVVDVPEGGGPAPEWLGLPTSVTGSSMSAALVTGAIAQAQMVRQLAGDPPLTWPEAVQLTYLTAVGLGRPARIYKGEGDVRRVSLCRLREALRCGNDGDPPEPCPAGGVVGCLQSLAAQVTVALPGTLFETCQACLAACGLDERCPEAEPAQLGWADGYVAAFEATADIGPVPGGPEAEAPPCATGEDEACPWDLDAAGGAVVDLYSLGQLGPQPSEGGCPDCTVVFSPGDPGLGTEPHLDRYLKLNPALDDSVEFQAAWLVAWVDGEVAAYAALGKLPGLMPWVPGDKVVVKGVPLVPGATEDPKAWAAAKAALYSQLVSKQWGKPVKDASPLYVTVPEL